MPRSPLRLLISLRTISVLLKEPMPLIMPITAPPRSDVYLFLPW